MSKYHYIILLLALFFNSELNAQSDSYIVMPTPFSSRICDEFSPVFYKGGIVFCSNERDNSLISYKDEQNRLFKIFFVTKRGSNGWNHPKILAKEITTSVNDGPATFNEKGNIIYYTRNNSIENSMRNISDTSNKLGIYIQFIGFSSIKIITRVIVFYFTCKFSFVFFCIKTSDQLRSIYSIL